jgi:hypothetical protein
MTEENPSILKQLFNIDDTPERAAMKDTIARIRNGLPVDDDGARLLQKHMTGPMDFRDRATADKLEQLLNLSGEKPPRVR